MGETDLITRIEDRRRERQTELLEERTEEGRDRRNY